MSNYEAMIQPSHNTDGTLTAVVARPAHGGGPAHWISLLLPADVAQGHPAEEAGRFFLARCGAQSPQERQENWHFYLRRPLTVAGHRPAPQELAPARGEDQPTEWRLLLPPLDDPGARWLAGLPPGAPVNLLGPFGQGFTLPPQRRNLLLLAEAPFVPLLLPLMDAMLDRGGRVTLLLPGEAAMDSALAAQLPLAVEVRTGEPWAALPGAGWEAQLSELLPWADALCGVIPAPHRQTLAEAIRRHRFRLEPGYAQVWVEADLVCGVGACLACAVEVSGGGVTRACVHGPVFDLVRLCT